MGWRNRKLPEDLMIKGRLFGETNTIKTYSEKTWDLWTRICETLVFVVMLMNLPLSISLFFQHETLYSHLLLAVPWILGFGFLTFVLISMKRGYFFRLYVTQHSFPLKLGSTRPERVVASLISHAPEDKLVEPVLPHFEQLRVTVEKIAAVRKTGLIRDPEVAETLEKLISSVEPSCRAVEDWIGEVKKPVKSRVTTPSQDEIRKKKEEAVAILSGKEDVHFQSDSQLVKIPVPPAPEGEMVELEK